MNNIFPAATVRLVYERARYCCEYCQTSQKVMGQAMHIEHINPERDDHPDNLCLACSPCHQSKIMAAKAPGAAALFNPRKQYWTVHFAWTDGGERLLGKTPIGRTTIELFGMNRDYVVMARRVWIRTGDHPPVVP